MRAQDDGKFRCEQGKLENVLPTDEDLTVALGAGTGECHRASLLLARDFSQETIFPTSFNPHEASRYYASLERGTLLMILLEAVRAPQ